MADGLSDIYMQIKCSWFSNILMQKSDFSQNTCRVSLAALCPCHDAGGSGGEHFLIVNGPLSDILEKGKVISLSERWAMGQLRTWCGSERSSSLAEAQSFSVQASKLHKAVNSVSVSQHLSLYSKWSSEKRLCIRLHLLFSTESMYLVCCDVTNKLCGNAASPVIGCALPPRPPRSSHNIKQSLAGCDLSKKWHSKLRSAIGVTLCL